MASRVWLAVLAPLIGVALWLASSTSASPGQERYVLRLRFLDSQTGYALAPDSIRLRNLESGRVEAISADTEYGRLELALGPGTYEVTAAVFSHEPMSAEVRVGEGPLPPVEFHLDPITPPKELADLRPRTGSFVLAGFVIDDHTGLPLRNVSVRTEYGSGSSDERGFFRLVLPFKGTRPWLNAAFSLRGFEGQLHRNIEFWSGGDAMARIRLQPGRGERVVDNNAHRTQTGELSKSGTCEAGCSSDTSELTNVYPVGSNSFVLPKNIRVGRNCTNRTNCTVVEVYTLDTYCARVLTSEWFSCWGSLAGGMHSLRAGAVAVRSYGVSFAYSPATPNYDICDITACQVMGNSASTNATNAVNDTTRYVILRTNGTILRSEYSAENNNAGCGDGFSGTSSSWPCISDPVCAGFATNGHGRGMCQWGTARWATGKRLSSSQACTSSAPSTGQPMQTWQWMIEHYYPGYVLAQGGTATISGIGPSPTQVPAGTTMQLTYAVAATGTLPSILLGASVAPTTTSNWISDPAHDTLTTIPVGNSNHMRLFTIPAAATQGAYDTWGSLYFDKNGSNTIDSGDFIVADGRFNSLFFVQPPSITVSPDTFAVAEGRLIAGGVPELQTSDDQRLLVRRWKSPASGPHVQLIVEGTSSRQSATKMTIKVEGYASVPGIPQSIEAFNFSTAAWVQLDSQLAGTVDTVRTLTIASGATNFIQPSTGKVRLKIGWLEANAGVPRWDAGVDQVQWTVGP